MVTLWETDTLVQENITGVIATAEGQPNTHGHINSDGNHRPPDFYFIENCEDCFNPAVGTHVIYDLMETQRGLHAVRVRPVPEISPPPATP